MKEITLKQILLNHLKSIRGFVNGGEFERIAMENGYKASNASRIMRKLCEQQVVIRELRPMRSGGKSVWYCYGGAFDRIQELDSQEVAKVSQDIKKILGEYRNNASKDLQSFQQSFI